MTSSSRCFLDQFKIGPRLLFVSNLFNQSSFKDVFFVGRYLPKDQNFAIGNFIADGIKGNEINVKTNRIVSRSYMYADDLVKWLLTIADNSKPTCPIYNVASDKEIEIR